MTIKEILSHEKRFRYMLLDRMKSDCEYYLGYGNRYQKRLWAGNEAKQIEYMKAIWNSFPDNGGINGKPEWLTWQDILNYEKEMVG